MPESDQLLQAIERYLAGQATAAEKQVLNDWYRSFNDADVEVGVDEPDYAQVVEARLRLRIQESTGIDIAPAKEIRTTRLWPRVAVVAAAVAALALFVYFFIAPCHLDDRRDLLVNDIAPGKSGATITLASGQVIALSDQKKGVIVGRDLKYADNTPVMSSEAPDVSGLNGPDKGSPGALEMTAETKKGQMYEFTLPDGTKVWLNADSKISFPSQFNGKERKILLSGEAYFAVVHNAKQPFRVESNGQVVEDIGTEFNINAYADGSSTKTTLVEGSAKVNDIKLKPNQQAVLINNTIKVTTIDPEQAIAWKNNKFMFESQDIREIMTIIARWYNVKVVYEGPVPEDKFGGSVSRFDNISKVLNALEKTKNVYFRVEERTVYVRK